MLKSQTSAAAEPGFQAWMMTPKLETAEFDLLRGMVADACGIKLSDSKVLLVQNRVGKRLRALSLASFRDYRAFLLSPEGMRQEMPNFLAAITTNETHFFREAHHFEIMKKSLLPALAARRPGAGTLRVWSAGCSTGQEVYTLAMILDEWCAGRTGWSYTVVGSDINEQVLAVAEKGIYPAQLKKEIPARYLMRHCTVEGGELRIDPTLRARVSFRQQNFADVTPQRPRLDLIFCRNAVMYLDRETRLRLAQVFRDSLVEGGYLLLGSSESLHGLPRLFHTQRFERTIVYQHRRELGEEVS